MYRFQIIFVGPQKSKKVSWTQYIRNHRICKETESQSSTTNLLFFRTIFVPRGASEPPSLSMWIGLSISMLTFPSTPLNNSCTPLRFSSKTSSTSSLPSWSIHASSHSLYFRKGFSHSPWGVTWTILALRGVYCYIFRREAPDSGA